MSFSSKVKEELAEQFPGGRHCLLAELAAISAMCGTFGADGEGEEILTIHTENEAVVRKCFYSEQSRDWKQDVLFSRPGQRS